MSRDYRRVDYREFRDDRRDRYRENDRSWGRNDYRDRYQKNAMPMKRRETNNRDKHRSRSPRKPDKDLIDDNILSEISKLPEPSELWDNQIQDGHQNYQQPSNYGQDGTNYGGNYQPQYTGIYDDFPPVAAAPPAPDMSSWNQMSLPPPPTVAPAPVYNMEDQIKKDAAIETEMRHQKAALSKQREDYIKKAGILKKELDTLKDQRSELRGDSKRSPSPDTKRFLKENTKLQLEIQNKLKTINNVVDMLNGIIGEEAAEVPDIEETERSSKRKSRSPSGNKFNYVYYDPEMHWCRVCNEFPPTAKDYLNHLHSAAHHKMASSHLEAPWHSIVGMNEGFPNHASAPTKRTPIKGLQFFVPSTAWYCKLCDTFIGDLHCASAHLKSVVHAKNFTNFVEQNPHWETDWMSDRQKAFEKSRAASTTEERYTAHTIEFNKDGFQMRRKSQSPERRRPKKKKKNKRKQSSSSDSDSDSDSDRKKKKDKKEKDRIEEEKMSKWMSSVQREIDDRKLFDTIKNRLKMEEATRRRETTQVLRSPSRERERRETNSRDERDTRRDERENRRDERENRRDERENRRETNAERKKPEIRKMPFIGKMPVYKNLSKTQKTEEQKKEELKKKDEDETKKRQEAMDAEIQRKVAEFKEKIARAQEERAAEQQLPPTLPPPAVMTVPPPVIAVPPPAPAPAAPGTQPQPNLPKDFQDALDIIFPSDVKKEHQHQHQHQQDMFTGVNMTMPPFQMPMTMPMNAYAPQPGILGEPPMMMGYNAMNNMNPMFPRPQLYDHVPVTTSNQNSTRFNNQKRDEEKQQTNKNREELDDLAMLGIDASDVGAGM